MNKESANGWHELKLGNDAIIAHPRKIKLLADQNIPKDLIEDLGASGIAIQSVLDIGYGGHPDENIREVAKKLNRILLTTDKDFWDERKHPIQKSFGIICCEAGPQDTDKLAKSIALFYVYFAKSFSLDLWTHLKALLKTEGFIIRQWTRDGNITENEYWITGGRILERKIR